MKPLILSEGFSFGGAELFHGMLHFIGEPAKVSMQSIEHVSFSLIGGKVSDQRSLGCVVSKLLDAGDVILHVSLFAKMASMLCRFFDNLDVGTEARPVKLQQPLRQLPQIVASGPDGEFARPSKGICRMNDQRRFQFPVAHFGVCKPGECSQSLTWAAVSACRARRRSSSRDRLPGGSLRPLP
ncbi:hypothetical protein ACQ5SK_12300 [Bradyrhizobium japonicum]